MDFLSNHIVMNKKTLSIKFLCACGCLILSQVGNAQKYISKENHISFFSSAPLEDIEAHNYKSTSVFDIESGKIAFSVPIKSFDFEKSLMQEHFNENYLESGKYPKAKFVGTVSGYDDKVSGKQKVEAKGTMEIHGVNKEMTVSGELEFVSDGIIITTKFPITVADHKIKIPGVVAQNIAEIVEVNGTFNYKIHE